MAKNNNLTDFLTDIANTIRNTDGTQTSPLTDANKINPQDFASRIVNYQEKTVTSSNSSQTITADTGYMALSKVTVNGMSNATITPDFHNSGLGTFFDTQSSATGASVAIVGKYTNTAGYVPEHNVPVYGTTTYYKIKTATFEADGASIKAATAGWIEADATAGTVDSGSVTVSDSTLSVSPSVTPTSTVSASGSSITLGTKTTTQPTSGRYITVVGGNTATTGSAKAGESSTVTMTAGYISADTSTITSTATATAVANTTTAYYPIDSSAVSLSRTSLSVSPAVTPTAVASATGNISLTAASSQPSSGYYIKATGGNSATSGAWISGQSSTITWTKGYLDASTSSTQKTVSSSAQATANASSIDQYYTIPTASWGTGTAPSGTTPTNLAFGTTYKLAAGYYGSDRYYKVPADPTPTLSGDAAAGDVLKDKTFYSNNYTKKTGTMVNNGAIAATKNPTFSGATASYSYTVPAGYHNGSGTVSGSVTMDNAAVSAYFDDGGSMSTYFDGGTSGAYNVAITYGDTVSTAGYVSGNHRGTKWYQIKAGSATTPTASGASTSTSLSGTTLTVARSVTPTVSTGWVTSGTAGTVTITGTVPTETKTASGSGDITPSSGKLLSKVTVGAGSATTPTSTITPSITSGWRDDGQGWYLQATGSSSVTPSVSAGWVASGTAGTVSISGGSTYFFGAIRLLNGTISHYSNTYNYVGIYCSKAFKYTFNRNTSFKTGYSTSGTTLFTGLTGPVDNDDVVITITGTFVAGDTIQILRTNSTSSTTTGVNRGYYTVGRASGCVVITLSGTATSSWTIKGFEINDTFHTKTCLIEGTLIMMADGTQRPIEAIRTGDIIKSYNPVTGEFVNTIVMENNCTTRRKIYDNILFSDGTKISYAESHEIYSLDRKCYVTLDNELRMNERVLNANGEEVRVIAVENWVEDEEEKRFFDIFTANMCYIANGLVFAHNNADISRIAIANGLADCVEKPVSENILRNELTNNKEYIAEFKEISSLKASLISQIESKKEYLKSTKYYVDEYNELGIAIPEYIVWERKWAYHEISKMSDEVKNYDDQISKLKAKYSSVGKDINLNEFELRSKLFLRACEKANKNSEKMFNHFRNIK